MRRLRAGNGCSLTALQPGVWCGWQAEHTAWRACVHVNKDAGVLHALDPGEGHDKGERVP